MNIKSIEVENFGPFKCRTKIDFESSVTVITGANDSGKTSVLNLIEVLYGVRNGSSASLKEEHANIDRDRDSKNIWQSDEAIKCWCTFDKVNDKGMHVTGQDKITEISFACALAPNIRRIDDIKYKREGDKWLQSGAIQLQKLPIIIRLPASDSIRPNIDLKSPNPMELLFLRQAFGDSYSHAKLVEASPSRAANLISQANQHLNKKLQEILPQGANIQIYIQFESESRLKISVHIADSLSSYTPVHNRGSGVQRLLALMCSLLSTNSAKDNAHMILLDEPENSLHSDAQHQLRSYLEKLGDQNGFQVIYATHSPSMINPMRSSAVRLLTRTSKDGYATTVVNNRPIDNNYLALRSSLGITPADSLLYSSVCLIVEGPTEVICLPIILKRLYDEKVLGFEHIDTILQDMHIIDGSGDSFPVLCKFALSQGTRPVIFLDGDKSECRINAIKKQCDKIPIVQIEDNKEIEEIVPKYCYIQSLSQVMAEFEPNASELLTEDGFDKWSKEKEQYAKRAFSKRIDLWVQDTIQKSVEKPLVMKHVMTNIDLTKVCTQSLLELIEKLSCERQNSLLNSPI